jgi:hypothetical protein
MFVTSDVSGRLVRDIREHYSPALQTLLFEAHTIAGELFRLKLQEYHFYQRSLLFMGCEARMQAVNEIIFLKEGNVKITNQRAVIGTKTYSLAHIASVRLQVKEPSLFLPIFFMVIIGVFLALIALTDLQNLSHLLRTGFYIFIVTFLLFFLSQKTKYTVRVKSSVGELNILEANDRKQVEKIVRAMETALLHQE